MNDMDKFLLGIAEAAKGKSQAFPTHCLCPGCMEPPIKSHSQQLKGALSVIAQDKKVIIPSRNDMDVLRRMLDGQIPAGRFHKIEIKRASTFKGFCAKHDTEMFLPIERRDLIQGDEEQVLAFQRRAVAFELMNKFSALVQINYACEAMKSLGIAPTNWDDEYQIQKMLLRADLDYEWNTLWNACPMSDLYYEWRVISKTLPVSLTTSISALPEHQVVEYTDRHIDHVSKKMDRPRPGFTLTIVPQETQTHVIMIWTNLNAPVVEPWRLRMTSTDDKVFEAFLNECVFCKSEDYCLSPRVWDMLSPSEKRTLELNLPDDNTRVVEQHVPSLIRI